MRTKSKNDLKEEISRQMRRMAQRLTTEQRRANGRKAWETRLANLATRLEPK